MTAAPELLPCPFCGGPAETRFWEWPYERYHVRCRKCHASAGGRLSFLSNAVEQWNTRTALARAPAPELIRQAVAEERERADKAEAELRVAIGGCDANNGWNHSPIRLPNDPKYVFCSACGETMTPSQAKRHSSAAIIRAGE